ncbi:hypothetical protein [Haloferula rosea]|uniref:Uncharacterized protein n=1 Tax=Haloferula rosea TaxID=490093 RepID=A0A934VF44_9BACT|nr:hypothetical protein [Haloferula rosea]MBK1827974.1 hypothetical protein [Haloferula rosea]
MSRLLRTFLLLALLIPAVAKADHVIVCGGPALRKWEDLRVPADRHDRWWANFVRASTLRMVEIRKAYGGNAPIVWIVHRPGYQSRSSEDGKPYTTWISDLARKRNVTLKWFDSSGSFISAMNSRPRGSIQTFDYFGHSNKYCFMFDYGNEIMAASTSWLHEDDLSRIKRSIFAKNAYCKSWGCHTAESMSKVWKRKLGVPLEGAHGPTDYRVVGKGEMPKVQGRWGR